MASSDFDMQQVLMTPHEVAQRLRRKRRFRGISGIGLLGASIAGAVAIGEISSPDPSRAAPGNGRPTFSRENVVDPASTSSVEPVIQAQSPAQVAALTSPEAPFPIRGEEPSPEPSPALV